MQESVLITGGGGYLGRKLAAALKPSHNVTLLCKDDVSAANATEQTGCAAIAVDIRDISATRVALTSLRPDIIIHAAAMKSVQTAEVDPLACSDLNVLGSQNVARVAMEIECSVVLGISSTRAAPPTSDTYGLTKALMERMFCSLYEKGDTKFSAVRLGNIAWSDGSVLPAWKAMLDESGVIQTTGPEMRRFFVTVDDAVDLVLTCLNNIDEFQGKVLVRDVKQAQVMDLLTAMVEAHGGSWEQASERSGDGDIERLIGDLELRHCSPIVLDGVDHYVLAFNETAPEMMATEVTVENAESMSAAGIAALITQPGDAQ